MFDALLIKDPDKAIVFARDRAGFDPSEIVDITLEIGPDGKLVEIKVSGRGQSRSPIGESTYYG